MAEGPNHDAEGQPEGTSAHIVSRTSSPHWPDLKNLPFAPTYRYRPRADGLVDETYRINFTAELTTTEIAHIGDALGRLSHEDRAVYGIFALAKLDFTLTGTCECTFICSADQSKARVELLSAVWAQIDAIHAIAAIDWTLWNRKPSR